MRRAAQDQVDALVKANECLHTSCLAAQHLGDAATADACRDLAVSVVRLIATIVRQERELELATGRPS